MSETRNRCKRCNIEVMDDTFLCPLCHGILTQQIPAGETDGKREGSSYPDVKRKTRRFHKAGSILFFLSLAVEAILVLINFLTFSSVPKYWSAVTGGVLAYLIFTVWDLVRRRQGHIRKIYMQVVIVQGLLLLMDAALGWRGWSVAIGLPCIIYGMAVAVIVCMCVNSSHWQNYILMQMTAVGLSILDLVLHFSGCIHHDIVLGWVALGISVLLWSGTMIIGDRKAENEMKRKFHL